VSLRSVLIGYVVNRINHRHLKKSNPLQEPYLEWETMVEKRKILNMNNIGLRDFDSQSKIHKVQEVFDSLNDTSQPIRSDAPSGIEKDRIRCETHAAEIVSVQVVAGRAEYYLDTFATEAGAEPSHVVRNE